jgi:3-oxoacyl-[acyl-carrier-protein] synthase III
MKVVISGRGVYLPRLSHTNETLPPLDTPATPEQLAKIGVVRRGWAGEGEGIADMAAAAAKVALSNAKVDANDIDLLVLSNWTQRRYIPEFAPRVQHLLGARRALAFDVSTACTGFATGLGIAHSFLRGPRYKRALVIASETTSQRARANSRATLVFGDAAAAWVVERDREDGLELIDYELQSDGSQHGVMEIDVHGHVRTLIEQKDLNALAARSFAESCRCILARNGMTMDDVQWVVPHSGTAGIQALLIKTLEIAPEKVFSNFSTVGNVSSAAIPVAFEELVSTGRIRKGDLVLSPTTGTGWYFGALLFRFA